MRKVVVACDSFKGCLDARSVAEAAYRGVMEAEADCYCIRLGVADGGEGTTDAILRAANGRYVSADAHDPLWRPITTRYGLATYRGKKTAVIESASASGLTLLSDHERNPLLTTTYGTGELIADGLRQGCRRFLIGLGGSATNDAGTGMLRALGFRFLDSDGKECGGCGGELHRIARIDASGADRSVKEAEYIVACDVDTPFSGPCGAARVFAPQKGASPEMVERLDAGMASLAQVIEREYGADVNSIAGGGAAGGLGAAFAVMLRGKLVTGVDMVLDFVDFDELLDGADLVITGEGRIDSQTPHGKVPSGVLARAKKRGIPTIAIAGSVEPCRQLDAMGFAAIDCINPPDSPLAEAMRPEVARERIARTVANRLREMRGS